jgi:hypothetical protein
VESGIFPFLFSLEIFYEGGDREKKKGKKKSGRVLQGGVDWIGRKMDHLFYSTRNACLWYGLRSKGDEKQIMAEIWDCSAFLLYFHINSTSTIATYLLRER